MKSEVTPKQLAIIIGALVVIVGGYFIIRGTGGPKVLNATGSAISPNSNGANANGGSNLFAPRNAITAN